MALGNDTNEETMRIARGCQSLQSEQIAAETRERREPDAHGPWLTNTTTWLYRGGSAGGRCPGKVAVLGVEGLGLVLRASEPCVRNRTYRVLHQETRDR